MASSQDRCRVVIAAREPHGSMLHKAFSCAQLQDWQALLVNSFEQVHFHLQHDSCQALLLDQDIYGGEDSAGDIRLAAQRAVPIVMLTDAEVEKAPVLPNPERPFWLPRQVALAYPALLNEALHQAVSWRDLRHDWLEARQTIDNWQVRANHLLDMLWETLPVSGNCQWYTQRSMLERLKEEVDLAARYHVPFSIALGEVQAADHAAARTWVVDRIVGGKRSSDIAGQYGPHGFMLLLPQTPESGAVACCRRLQDLLEPSRTVPPPQTEPARLRPSFGIASYSAAHASAKSLLYWAEHCLENSQTGEALAEGPSPH